MKTLLLISLTMAILAMPLIGQDWQVEQENDFPFDANDGFFINATVGWLACDDGVVVKTVDGGQSGVETIIAGADGLDLKDIEFANELIGYTCTDDGFIYKTIDGGLNWTMIADTANYTADLKDLSVVSETLVYFAGKDSTVLKTEDGGDNFTRIAYGFQGEDIDGGIDFISPTQGVAIADANNGHTWYTHDGGDTWEYVQLQFPPGTSSKRIYDVDGAADSTFAIAAYHRLTFISTDGGKTYMPSGDVEYGYDYYIKVQALDASTIISSGSDGFVVKTLDGGANWDTLNVGSGQSGIFHQFLNANDGYVFLKYVQWKKTTDGGDTWSPLQDWPQLSFWGLALASDMDLFITSWGGGELSESHDGGASWSYPDNYKTMTTENLYEIEFSDADNGLTGGGSGNMRITDDGGANWTFVDNPMYQQSNKHINSLRYMNMDTVFAGGSSGIIMRSVDGGLTWEEMGKGGTQTVYDLWPVTPELIMASAGSGQIYLSNATLDTFEMANDYGSMLMRAVEFRGDIGLVAASKGIIFKTTIDEIDTLYEVFTEPDGDDFYDVEFISDSVAYVVGEAGKIYKTVNGGMDWTAETSPTEETLPKLAYGNNILWAVGQAGTIIKLDMTPNSIDNGEWKIVNAYELSQNYPNPFNPSTTISFVLQKSGLVELDVYNIAGQKVATVLNKKMKSGRNNVTWDAGHLASGVYFYKLTSGDFSAVKKMMLLK